eukprot:TRINITY_DN2594_c0_g1_i13.p1 TRINITY_DN2594_c0_g1~~TRINITY_DN2594_c0_g1_i13.p1  ORF type:complete len:144 (-),score=20.48 TRINITY_DN2594_c0_g1_i13:308-739(-)
MFARREGLLLLAILEDVGQAALAAVLTVEVGSHEGSGTTTARLSRAGTTEHGNLTVLVDLVVVQHGQLDLGVPVLDLFGLGVHLLLALLTTTTKTEHEMEGAFLLNVVVGEGAAILELLTGEDKTLLVRGDSCESEGKQMFVS